MFTGCRTPIKETTLNCARLGLLPGIDDSLTTAFRSDVMPEEWLSGLAIVAFLIDQTRAIRVEFVVYSDGFFLWLSQLYVWQLCDPLNLLAWLDSSPRAWDQMYSGPRLS